MRQTKLNEHHFKPADSSQPSNKKASRTPPNTGAGPPPKRNKEQERSQRKVLAHEVLDALKNGFYVTPNGDRHDIQNAIKWSESNTRFYSEDSSVLVNWLKPPSRLVDPQPPPPTAATTFKVIETSTIATARSYFPRKDVGVLNFASAKHPGGGFLSGAQAQEESIARSSTVYGSLKTETGAKFYKYNIDNKGETKLFYSHSMIYSPGVVLMRNDSGSWDEPYAVAVVTSAAVNAGEVRKRSNHIHDIEEKIESAMKERMGRILKLFEDRGVRVLVLGSFGTGVFRNSVPVVARLWAELLGAGGRFHGVFEEVAFGIIGAATFMEFRKVFTAEMGKMQAAKTAATSSSST